MSISIRTVGDRLRRIRMQVSTNQQRNQRNAIIDTGSIDCNAIFKRDMQALSNVDAWRG